MKRLIIALLLLTSLLWAGDIALYNEDGTLTCTTAGIAYIASTQAYGEWEFVINVDLGTEGFKFIASTTAGGDDYSLTIANGVLYLAKPGVANLFGTAAGYISYDTDYKIKITRNETTDQYGTGAKGTFYVYIQGGSFGESYQLIDVSGGSGTNPVTDNAYTISNYFVLDLDTADKISNIHLTDGNLDVRDFTVSSGAYSTSGTYYEEIPAQQYLPDLSNAVAYYPLSDYWSVGTDISDLSGNNNSGTSLNTPVFVKDQNGVGSQGQYFDGTDYNTLSSIIDFADDTEWTISFWVWVDVEADAPFFMGWNTASRIQIVAPNLRVYNTSGNPSSFPMTLSGWDMITVIADGTDADNLSVYQNGAFVQTNTFADTAMKIEALGSLTTNSVNALVGTLSDVIFYSEAKSATWALAQYTAQQYTGHPIYNTLNKGLVFYTPMTTGYMQSATVLTDMAGENHAPASGNPVIGADDTTFDGTDAFTIPNSFNSTFKGDFSICIWAKPDDGQPLTRKYLFGDWVDVDGRQLIRIELDGKIKYSFVGNSDEDSIESTSAVFPNGATDWTHLTITGDQSAHEIKMYVNGVIEPITQGNTITSGNWALYNSTTNQYFLGDYEDATGSYVGKEKDCRIYNRILTTTEMKSIMEIE